MRVAERRRTAGVFAGLMIGLFLAELDQTVFATALPTVVGELDAVGSMYWVATAYLLTATVTMPVYGMLGDRLGRRAPFLGGLVVFVLGSVLGGLAPDLSWLLAARAVQGVGAGGLLILIQALVADLAPERQRANYLSAIGAVFAVAAVLGPPLGGWLADGVGWRWAFWLNVPLGAVSIVVAARFLPRPQRQPPALVIDGGGIVAVATGVTAAVLLASWAGTTYPWRSPVVLGLAVLLLLSVVGFVLAERRAAQPLIPLDLLRRPGVAVSTAAGLVMAAAAFGSLGYLPTYLQMATGLSPTRAGLLLLALIAGLGLATVGSGLVVSRTGTYRWLAVLGTLGAAAALVLLSTLRAGTDLRVVGGYLFLLGAGMGATLQVLVLMAQLAAPAAQVGTATAAHNFFREIGVVVGSAVVGAVFTARLGRLLPPASGAEDGAGTWSLTPEQLAELPPALRLAVATAYGEALTPVLLGLVPLLLISAAALLGVRPHRLRGESAAAG